MEAGHTATGAAPRLAVQDQNQNYFAKRFKTLPRHRWAADRSETSTSEGLMTLSLPLLMHAKAAAAPALAKLPAWQAFEIP